MTRTESVTDRPADLLTPAQVQAEYGIAKKTLANWRWQRRGPEFVKTAPGKGGRAMYRRTAIERWLDRSTVSTAPS